MSGGCLDINMCKQHMYYVVHYSRSLVYPESIVDHRNDACIRVILVVLCTPEDPRARIVNSSSPTTVLLDLVRSSRTRTRGSRGGCLLAALRARGSSSPTQHRDSDACAKRFLYACLNNDEDHARRHRGFGGRSCGDLYEGEVLQ